MSPAWAKGEMLGAILNVCTMRGMSMQMYVYRVQHPSPVQAFVVMMCDVRVGCWSVVPAEWMEGLTCSFYAFSSGFVVNQVGQAWLLLFTASLQNEVALRLFVLHVW